MSISKREFRNLNYAGHVQFLLTTV
jgi:hypothetical protein